MHLDVLFTHIPWTRDTHSPTASGTCNDGRIGCHEFRNKKSKRLHVEVQDSRALLGLFWTRDREIVPRGPHTHSVWSTCVTAVTGMLLANRLVQSVSR